MKYLLTLECPRPCATGQSVRGVFIYLLSLLLWGLFCYCTRHNPILIPTSTYFPPSAFLCFFLWTKQTSASQIIAHPVIIIVHSGYRSLTLRGAGIFFVPIYGVGLGSPFFLLLVFSSPRCDKYNMYVLLPLFESLATSLTNFGVHFDSPVSCFLLLILLEGTSMHICAQTPITAIEVVSFAC